MIPQAYFWLSGLFKPMDLTLVTLMFQPGRRATVVAGARPAPQMLSVVGLAYITNGELAQLLAL